MSDSSNTGISRRGLFGATAGGAALLPAGAHAASSVQFASDVFVERFQPAPGGRSWGGAARWKAGDAGSTGKIRVSRCDDGAGGFGSPKVGPPATSGRGGSAHTRPTR